MTSSRVAMKVTLADSLYKNKVKRRLSGLTVASAPNRHTKPPSIFLLTRWLSYSNLLIECSFCRRSFSSFTTASGLLLLSVRVRLSFGNRYDGLKYSKNPPVRTRIFLAKLAWTEVLTQMIMRKKLGFYRCSAYSLYKPCIPSYNLQWE